MIEVNVKAKIPFLWGKASFEKSSWANVNLIVGPNGSGKTLLAEQIERQFADAGYDINFLRAERQADDDAAAMRTIRENQAVRQKIEDVLSNMFAKAIRFEEAPGGRLVAIVVNKARGVEYNLKQGECHGLKEILTLLVALYGNSSNKKNCLILDEPELHLHPQFQQFFMNEIKKASAAEPKRVFFIITHSPYFIDLNFSEDLLGVVACHVNRAPTSIDSLSDYDEQLFRRFLPRFNTYHKQFFFSDRQIFVEGYTDQQIFTRLLSCVDSKIGSAGTGVIDVGGKDELGVFFKVCSLLGTDGRIITDLDSLFCGKLREEVCADQRTIDFLEAQREKQDGFYASLFTKKELAKKITLEKLIIRLERYLGGVGEFLADVNHSVNPEIDILVEKVKSLYAKYENPENLDTYKTVVLMGVTLERKSLEELLPLPLAASLGQIINLANLIFAAIECSRVYILRRGCIEHYYTQTDVHYMPVSSKDRIFHSEIEYMLDQSSERLKKKYEELLAILNKACS